MREGDRQLRELGPQQVPHLELVLGVDIGVDQADRDCLDSLVADAGEQRLEAIGSQWRLDRPVPAQPFHNLYDVPPWH